MPCSPLPSLFFYSLYVLITAPPFTVPFPKPRVEASSEFLLTLAHQVFAELGTSSSTEARQSGPFRGTGSTDSQGTGSGKPPTPVVGGDHEDQAAHLLHMWGA